MSPLTKTQAASRHLGLVPSLFCPLALSFWFLVGCSGMTQQSEAVEVHASVPAMEWSLKPQNPRQGQVATVRISRVNGDTLPTDLGVRFGAQPVALWPCSPEPSQCGLVAVPLDTPVGEAAVELSAGSGRGRQLQTKVLQVRKGNFKVNVLSVDPSRTKPDATQQARMDKERKEIDKAYRSPIPAPQWTGTFQLPTGGIITSLFGNQRRFNGELRSTHFGVDLRAGTSTPIRATNAGVVVLAKEFFVAGNMVLIDHGMRIYSSYSHLSSLQVKPGDQVQRGQVLGNAGATGRVTGPHLHWAMRLNGVPVDPHALRRAFNGLVSVSAPATSRK